LQIKFNPVSLSASLNFPEISQFPFQLFLVAKLMKSETRA
jgi:hypothetical protein